MSEIRGCEASRLVVDVSPVGDDEPDPCDEAGDVALGGVHHVGHQVIVQTHVQLSKPRLQLLRSLQSASPRWSR